MKYPEDYINKIICGDCLEVLKTFPDESVDCVITSPPYWGLRDYGTATWRGGKPDCDHKMPRSTNRHRPGDKSTTNEGSDPITWQICGKCGAEREDAQLGLEKTPEEYVASMVKVFSEVKRVLKKDGTLWLNLGDTYSAARWSSGKGQPMNKNKDIHRAGKETEERASGLPDKNLVGIPWRVAFALQSDGWYLRQDIIWAKPNPMPESVTDRCTKSHEYIFLLTKSPKYYFDNEAIKEPLSESYKNDPRHNSERLEHSPLKDYKGQGKQVQTPTQLHDNMFTKPIASGRNKRSVWTITTKPFKEAHFATFPEDLIVPMVLAGCPKGGIVLDPFGGAMTTCVVAKRLQRNFVAIELNPKYIEIGERRLAQVPVPIL